jgi:hypothetical protein
MYYTPARVGNVKCGRNHCLDQPLYPQRYVFSCEHIQSVTTTIKCFINLPKQIPTTDHNENPNIERHKYCEEPDDEEETTENRGHEQIGFIVMKHSV